MKLRSMTTMLCMLLALTLAGAAVAHPGSGQDSEPKQEAMYPNATRVEPKIDLTSQKTSDLLNTGLDAVNNGDATTALQVLPPLANGSDTDSKYAQALALQGLATLKYNQQDVKGAIDLQKQALALGVMPNDTYFQLMYMLAQYYVADQQFSQALATLQQWRSEGKRETAESYGLEGNIDYQMEKYPEAIAAIKKAESLTDKPQASWQQILAASYAETGQGDQALALARQALTANPNDAVTLHNTVALLVQAEKYSEAIDLLEQARSKGTLTDARDYVTLAKLHMMIAQNGTDPETNATKAAQILEEGIGKGVIKPDYDAYKLEGDAAFIGGDRAKAIAAYAKAAPLGKDGEADLRRSQLLIEVHKYKEGKAAAQTAISKGVKHPGTAWMLVAEAERSMKNKPGAVQAMQKAAQYPETQARAKAWLKNAGH